jgi:S-adenosylmethionine:tRNA ribosyltransferase-isomerase
MKLEEFDYHLPQELIAQQPLPERGASRLLHLDGDALHDAHFRDLPSFLNTNDILVFNDTRVIKARLFGVKQSGGKCEVLVERVLNEREVLAQVNASHPPKLETFLRLEGRLEVEVCEKRGEFFQLRFPHTVLESLEQYGRVPLPPYIEREASKLDESRYQTVYAESPGAIAAPTAGLHFDQRILDELRAAGITLASVTLHIGAGTFQPVRTEEISQHRMHTERFHIPQTTIEAIEKTKAAGGRVVVVGTTTLRAIEAAAQSGELKAGEGETSLFITPGSHFRVVDRLLTNFHLPKSTLLILVSAFAGIKNIRRAYRHAIEQRYRFFSYGDAMLIERVRN